MNAFFSRHRLLATLGLLALATGCNGVGQFDLSGATISANPNTFPGLSSISDVTGSTVQLNWTSASDASVYQVYNTTSGSEVLVTALFAPASSYTVTGLNPSTTYKFRVRMLDTNGDLDANTHDQSATTLSVVASFNGWTGIEALGATTPVSQSGITAAPAQITLSWSAYTLSSGSVSSYNIYRVTSSGSENYGSPYATGISTSTLSYTDTSVTAGTTYYYEVAPVVGTTPVTPSSTADLEVSVITPPNNMALLHRWAVNQEICGLMGRSTDRNNNYRCAYDGPTNVGGYFDFETTLFVDTYGEGCNYTMDTANCSSSGCIGTSGAPAGSTGVVGDVWYDRSSGNCYVKTASSTWTSQNSSMSSTAYQEMASNSPGLPPLVDINQTNSWNTCQAFSVSGYSNNKRLLRHSEQIIAAAWPASWSDTTIGTVENGSSLNTTGYCNANRGSGLVYDDNTVPGNLDTLPGTLTSTIESVRLGSTATKNCVSRYGIQDMVGNVWNWNSDQLETCDSTTCQGATSGLDTSNTDWNGFNFDGTIGPGGVSGTTQGTLASEALGSATFDSFQVVLGLPMVSAAASSWDYLTIGTGTGDFNPAKFHGNYFWLNPSTGGGSPARGALAGGAWNNGSNDGRFALSLINEPSNTNTNIGFRCALPAD